MVRRAEGTVGKHGRGARGVQGEGDVWAGRKRGSESPFGGQVGWKGAQRKSTLVAQEALWLIIFTGRLCASTLDWCWSYGTRSVCWVSEQNPKTSFKFTGQEISRQRLFFHLTNVWLAEGLVCIRVHLVSFISCRPQTQTHKSCQGCEHGLTMVPVKSSKDHVPTIKRKRWII